MADESPKLDPRTLDEIISDTEALAMAHSPWRPSTTSLDFGGALVRLFGSMVEHVVAQLNQVPHKHHVAFTRLLGAKRIPPRAARVPLELVLTPGEDTAVVPQGAQAAATTADGTIMFETELELPLTRAQLVAVFVRDVAARGPNGVLLPPLHKNRYADRTSNAHGKRPASFEAFGTPEPAIAAEDPENREVEHALYIDVGDPKRLNGTTTIEIAVTKGHLTPPALTWSTATADGWTAPVGTKIAPDAIIEATVDHQSGNWLRAEVPRDTDESTTIGLAAIFHVSGGQNVMPELGYFNAQKLDLSRDFAPFGDRPRPSDACYFACDEAFGLTDVTVTLSITLGTPAAVPTAPAPVLMWEKWTDKAGWTTLVADPTAGFTTKGDVTFTLVIPIDESVVNGIKSRWIRVRLDSGGYNNTATPPVYSPPMIASARLSWTADVKPTIVVRRQTAATYDDPIHGAVVSPYLSAPERAHGDPVDLISTLNLGFDRAFEPQRTTLYFEVVPPASPEPASFADPPVKHQPLALVWETRKANTWVPLAVEDDTRNFSRSGVVRFEPPTDPTPLDQFGHPALQWLRVRPADPSFAPMPQLRRIALNTVWAAHQHTTALELLGGSNGTRSQTFRLAQTPVLEGQQIEIAEPQPPAPSELLRLQADEGPDVVTAEILDGRTQYWVRWHEVADFWASGPRDRHYTFDAATGSATFGNGVNGMIPPTGTRNVRAASYRSGGGPTGNVPIGTITQLKTTVPGVDRVSNFEPAVGGAPLESEAAFMDRASRTLRHGHRAVCAQDYADLALEASKAVARAVALTPAFSPIDQAGGALTGPTDLFRDGQVIVVIVPALASPGHSPSVDLLAEVEDYLRARCPPAARVQVIGPSWVAATIDVGVAAKSFEETDAVRERVHAAINALLDPVTGGTGAGWELGRRPRTSDLLACIMAVPGVDHVSHLDITCAAPFDKDDKNLEVSLDERSLYERLLVYADTVAVHAAQPKVPS